MNTALPRFVVSCFALFCLSFGLLALPAGPARAADLYVLGGGGGGGGAQSTANYGGHGGGGGGGGAGAYVGNTNPNGSGGNGGDTGWGTGLGTGGSGGVPGNDGSDSTSGTGAAGGAGGTGSGTGAASGTAGSQGTNYASGDEKGGDGGNGGSATATQSGSYGTVLIQGGDGGDAGGVNPNLRNGGDGGDGGNASLTATDLSASTSFSMVSGTNGSDTQSDNQSGAGGAASFTATTLTAPIINLTKNDGALTFTLGTLNVFQDTALTLNNTFAGDVFINGLAFSGGSALTVTQGNSGTMTFGGNLSVAGSGNTLNSPIAFDASGAGKTHTFNLSGVAANSTMLTVQTSTLDITGAAIAINGNRTSLDLGQSVTLISATTLTTDITTLTIRSANGDIYTLTVSGSQLSAMLQSLSPTTPFYERLKAYAESRAANLAFVNQGQDLILSQGMGSALAVTSGSGFRMNAFGGMGGGSSRYNTGSHADVDGFSMLAGLAVGNDLPGQTLGGRLTLGGFFEGGWGSYDSYNSFANYASAKGSGDTSYMGVGALGRYDLTQGALSGLYADASIRLGRARADFNSGDITYNGNNADFDSAAMYYGLHGGLGWLWSLNEAASLDFSAKLLWTRQGSDSANVSGDKLNLEGASSLRSRLGGRFAYAVNERFTPYAGAYWEHEFDGKARSSVNGNKIDAPDLEGSTGVGELGLSLKPAPSLPLAFDLGLQGYTGVREGVSGSLQAKWSF